MLVIFWLKVGERSESEHVIVLNPFTFCPLALKPLHQIEDTARKIFDLLQVNIEFLEVRVLYQGGIF